MIWIPIISAGKIHIVNIKIFLISFDEVFDPISYSTQNEIINMEEKNLDC